MFTKNYYRALAAYLCKTSVTIVSANRNEYTIPSNGYPERLFRFMNDDGNYPSLKRFNKYEKESSSYSYYGVVFGNGTAPATLDDYQLAGDHFQTYDAFASITSNSTEDYTEIVATYTITNTGTSEFTISEIGLTSCYNSYNEGTLVERTLLDTPVTIPAGGVGQVIYTIRTNYPAI